MACAQTRRKTGSGSAQSPAVRVKRYLRAFWLLFAFIPLLGALSAVPPPVVVVYPLTVSGGADPEAGSNIAVLLATNLTKHGGLNVKPYPPGTDRPHYLSAARAVGAEYYITGFLTTLGDEVSLILQVVSTDSGTIVQSNTAFVRTYGEAAGQADLLAEIMIQHSGRALSQLDNPQPAASQTPVPDKNQKADESNFLGLFHHRAKATPTPKPSPSAAPAGNVPAVAVTPAPAITAPPQAPQPAANGPTRPAPSTQVPAPNTGLPNTSGSNVPAAHATPLPSGDRVLVLLVGGDADAKLASHAGGTVASEARRNGLAAEQL